MAKLQFALISELVKWKYSQEKKSRTDSFPRVEWIPQSFSSNSLNLFDLPPFAVEWCLNASVGYFRCKTKVYSVSNVHGPSIPLTEHARPFDPLFISTSRFPLRTVCPRFPATYLFTRISFNFAETSGAKNKEYGGSGRNVKRSLY